MKIRYGFVSNSSSSSYVFAYNKKSVLTDPTEIVDYIDKHFRNEIMFISEFCDGMDAFILGRKQKNYLLKHKKRFIKYNADPVTVSDYSAEYDEEKGYPQIKVPAVTAYTGVYSFNQYPFEWPTALEIDMSDVPKVELTTEECIAARKEDASEELKNKVKLQEDYYRIKDERERKAYRDRKQTYLKEIRENLLKNYKINPEDLAVEMLEVDYDSCDPDGNYEDEFATRFFGLDEETYYEDIGDPELGEEVEE